MNLRICLFLFAAVLAPPLVACGDSPAPTEIDSVDDPSVLAASGTMAGIGIAETLRDPFLQEILADLGDRHTADQLSLGLLRAGMTADVEGQAAALLAVGGALKLLEGYPVRAGEPDDPLNLAVLDLMLQDVAHPITPKGVVR